MALLRSMLFVPANRPRLLAKAGTLPADALILDLEDSVPIEEKPATRHTVREEVQRLVRETPALIYVRVNPMGAGKNAFSQDFAEDDLRAVVGPGLKGIVLPKTESAEEIIAVDDLLCSLEAERGLEPGSIDVEPILETAKGIINAYEICCACSRRVRRVSIGAGDLTLDIGVTWTRDENELQYARASVVMASRAAGLEAPIDGVFNSLEDLEGQERSALVAKGLGFQGKQCVHPSAIPILNRVFSPSEEAVDYARRAIAAFDQAVSDGQASIRFEGKMLDYPIVQREREVLARAAEIEQRTSQFQ